MKNEEMKGFLERRCTLQAIYQKQRFIASFFM